MSLSAFCFDEDPQWLHYAAVKPAPYLQVAALVTSLTLGGSYVLYRGGVLTLPRPGPTDAKLAPVAEKDERIVPAMMAGSKSAVLSFTTVSGSLTPEQVAPAGISVHADLEISRHLQLALDPQTAGTVPISLVTTPPMMGSSKFAVIDFSAPQIATSPPQQPQVNSSTPTAAPAPVPRLMMSGSKSGGISFATPPSLTFTPQQLKQATLDQPTSGSSTVQQPAQPQAAQPARR